MALRTSKPAFNLREKVSELDRPVGSHGSQVMKSDNVGETFDLIQAGRRNTIINGCMRFNQRGESSYDGTECTLDRWKYHRSTDGEFDIKQSTEAPSGFSHSLHVDCKVASATVTSNAYARLRYHIEGNDCRRFGKGTQTPKNFCLSFYAKSNVLGTYATNLQDHNSKIITRTYTVTDDKWNRYTIVFPNSTANPITTTNTTGLEIQFMFIAGLNQTGGDARHWGAWAANKQGDGHTVNLYSSTSNNFYLTGVQLEPGNQPTPFEYRSYAEELALCQRYYMKRNLYGNCSTGFSQSGGGYNSHLMNIPLPVKMRSTPTVTFENGSATGAFQPGGNNANFSTLASGQDFVSVQTGSTNSTWTTQVIASQSPEINLSAEI